MSRPRKDGNKDLPPNLYCKRVKGKDYFSYRRPDNNKIVSINATKEEAILAATTLNNMLGTSFSVVDRVLAGGRTFGDWVEQYKEIRGKEGLKPKTLVNLFSLLNQLKGQLGMIPLSQVSIFHMSECLALWADEGKLRSAEHLRSTLVVCFDYAVGYGLLSENPARKLLPFKVKTRRQRLTLETYREIRRQAPVDIQNAMDLSLITLQRREDLVNMKQTDIHDNKLHVIQSKSGRNKNSRRSDAWNPNACLQIGISGKLVEIIARCLNSGVESDYLVHHLKSFRYGGKKEGFIRAGDKLNADNLSRGFRLARDKTKLFEGVPVRERPSFHEIRALGAHLYQQQGINPKALLGHTYDKTTQVYLDGHEVKWTRVDPNLDLDLD